MTDAHPAVAIGWSFAAGLTSGLLFVCCAELMGVTSVTTFVDRAGDGIGFLDAAVLGWFAGNVAILVHHVLPAVAWR